MSSSCDVHSTCFHTILLLAPQVGGLPEDLQFELIEPLRELFKVGATQIEYRI